MTFHYAHCNSDSHLIEHDTNVTHTAAAGWVSNQRPAIERVGLQALPDIARSALYAFGVHKAISLHVRVGPMLS